jgi:hypothetical protein
MARWAGTLAAVAALALPAVAGAHVERSSYWPNPQPDTRVEPAAGGAIPDARSLVSALDPAAVGETHVVCKPNSLRIALRAISRARANGYVLRPSLGRLKLTRQEAALLAAINRELFARCEYEHIQRAVFAAGNNDRIVVMPGTYLEEPSRAKPTGDPKCDRYREPSENGAGAATYRFQVRCPNDQSLIYVQGRKLTPKPVPYPPLADRHGIPDSGHCVRCNLQIDGSGVVPTDVVIDAARDPRTGLREFAERTAKDVGMRVDRADGFVIRNMTFAHAGEHGLYIHETDGYLVDRVEWYYSHEYGLLAFTSDHGLTQNCEGVGHGDSAVYPGAAPETGEQRGPSEADPRANQIIRYCDIHHNTLGYSGTMGNATRVVHNEFYDNGTAIATDSFFAGGHPGYPQDSAVFAHNDIYSNNFNSFTAGSDVVPRVPVPVGVGILIAGGNNNDIHHNRIWNNWRRGTMQISLPDPVSFVDDPSQVEGVRSNSHRNRYHDNVMGKAPGGAERPNGVDFWTDDFPGGEDNCWFRNGTVTTDPPSVLLPSNCNNVTPGLTYVDHAPELLSCLASVALTGTFDPATCSWFATPPRPDGSSALPLRAMASSGEPAVASADPAGLGGVQIGTATCSEWRTASTEEQDAAIARLEEVAAPGDTLEPDQAHEALDGYCGSEAGRGFLLYEIYNRAATFTPDGAG